MPFYIYKRFEDNGKEYLESTGEEFRLAGYNLLYQLWVKNDKPIKEGWHVDAENLIKQWSNGTYDYSSHRLIIDANPKARWRVNLLELLDVYVYTDGNKDTRKAYWSPMMLKLRQAFYKTYDPEITAEQKMVIIKRICEPNYTNDIMEFLYLHGDDRGWNWGLTGRTNAAFLEKKPREYFKKFF